MIRRQQIIWTLMAGLCGLLPCLVGCPGTDGTPSGSPIASMFVQGIHGGTTECAIPLNETALRAKVIELVNLERTGRGIGEVRMHPLLNRMAEDYACEMIAGSFFAHENPNTGEGPGHRAINAGYIYLAIGENLAGGQTSPEQVVSEWMQSTQGHRENILASQWQDVGVGIRTGGRYGVYWVLEFGNPP